MSYVEDDVQMPLLTPNVMLFLNSNLLPELQPHHIETTDLRKRAKHLLKCKEAIWSRWTKEYLRSLRERHRAQRGDGRDTPAVGDVVIVKTEDKSRGKWPLGIIENLIVGNDGVVRGAKLRAGKSYMERAIQQLYPLELSCDRHLLAPQAGMNPEAALTGCCSGSTPAFTRDYPRGRVKLTVRMNSAISLQLAHRLTL